MNWVMSQLHTALIIQDTVPGIIAILKFRQRGNKKRPIGHTQATIIINFKVIFHGKTQFGYNALEYAWKRQ